METWLVELKGTEKSLEFLRNHLKTHNVQRAMVELGINPL